MNAKCETSSWHESETGFVFSFSFFCRNNVFINCSFEKLAYYFFCHVFSFEIHLKHVNCFLGNILPYAIIQFHMSRVMRKPAFCMCENKGADQLRGSRTANQRLCFCCIDSAIPLLPKFEISIHQPSSVAVQPSLCRTWSETWKTDFLTSRLK